MEFLIVGLIIWTFISVFIGAATTLLARDDLRTNNHKYRLKGKSLGMFWGAVTVYFFISPFHLFGFGKKFLSFIPHFLSGLFWGISHIKKTFWGDFEEIYKESKND